MDSDQPNIRCSDGLEGFCLAGDEIADQFYAQLHGAAKGVRCTKGALGNAPAASVPPSRSCEFLPGERLGVLSNDTRNAFIHDVARAELEVTAFTNLLLTLFRLFGLWVLGRMLALASNGSSFTW